MPCTSAFLYPLGPLAVELVAIGECLRARRNQTRKKVRVLVLRAKCRMNRFVRQVQTEWTSSVGTDERTCLLCQQMYSVAGCRSRTPFLLKVGCRIHLGPGS